MVGFFLGGALIRLLDLTVPHIHRGVEKAEGQGVTWSKNILLVLAVTLHNMSEGLAVGLAFGGVTATLNSFAYSLALGAVEQAFTLLSQGPSLASVAASPLGTWLQNTPEGLAVSMPLRVEGLSIKKSMLYGQFSAVKPVFAVVGVATVLAVTSILPIVMSLVASAMIFISVEELIPESQKNPDHATMSFMLGFAAVMLLDIAFTV